MGRRRKNTTGIPDYEIDSLARALLPAMRAYLASEEGQREFAAWQAERQLKLKNNAFNENLIVSKGLTVDFEE